MKVASVDCALQDFCKLSLGDPLPILFLSGSNDYMNRMKDELKLTCSKIVRQPWLIRQVKYLISIASTNLLALKIIIYGVMYTPPRGAPAYT